MHKMQNGAISKYLTGFDRQLESVKVLGKMSAFTIKREARLELDSSEDFHCLLASLTKRFQVFFGSGV